MIATLWRTSKQYWYHVNIASCSENRDDFQMTLEAR